MAHRPSQYTTLILLIAGILAIIIMRTWLAVFFDPPVLSDLFNTITIIGSLIVLLNGYRTFQRNDWILALALGGLVGAGMYFATLFSPFPFFGIVRDNVGQAWVRGIYTMLATLGGLTIMRQGGPIAFHIADGKWRMSAHSFVFGLAVGIPLAVLNVFGLQFTQGQSLSWQNPPAALLDAFQPGIVEEVIYRFALWGLLWLVLRTSLHDRAIWTSGLIAMLVHNYSHFDDLFVQAPLVALGMGLVIAIVWGLPPTLLANYRGMEAAIAFHWIQDVARFLAGF
jgi:hypothetical protein